jgi:hypothetical protein
MVFAGLPRAAGIADDRLAAVAGMPFDVAGPGLSGDGDAGGCGARLWGAQVWSVISVQNQTGIPTRPAPLTGGAVPISGP